MTSLAVSLTPVFFFFNEQKFPSRLSHSFLHYFPRQSLVNQFLCANVWTPVSKLLFAGKNTLDAGQPGFGCVVVVSTSVTAIHQVRTFLFSIVQLSNWWTFFLLIPNKSFPVFYNQGCSNKICLKKSRQVFVAEHQSAVFPSSLDLQMLEPTLTTARFNCQQVLDVLQGWVVVHCEDILLCRAGSNGL